MRQKNKIANATPPVGLILTKSVNLKEGNYCRKISQIDEETPSP